MSADEMLTGISPAVLDRYVADECTPEEVRIVHAWLDGNSARQSVLTQLREVRLAARTRGPWDTQRMWRRLAQDIEGDEAQLVTPGRPVVAPHFVPTERGRSWRWAVPAAAVALVLGIVAIFVSPRGTSHRTTVPVAYATGRGQRATVRLADGTAVILAPASRLLVHADFGADNRTVSLSGEAVFKVTASHEAPFLVQTEHVTTRVLGTAFDVRRYPTDAATQVVVLNGKVAAGATHRTAVTLVGGMVGSFTDSTATVIDSPNATTLTEWTDGRLRFRETPVGEVLAQLGRWYDVDFQLADSTLIHEKVTVALNHSATSDVVQILEDLLSVNASSAGTQNGHQVIVLQPRRTTRRIAPVRLRHERQELTPTEVGR